MSVRCWLLGPLPLPATHKVLLAYWKSGANQFLHRRVPVSLCQRCLHHSKHMTYLRNPQPAFKWGRWGRYQSTKAMANAVKVGTKGAKKGRPFFGTGEIRRLFLLARPEKWRLAGAVGLLLISSAVTMSVPFALGKVIDLIYTTDSAKMKDNLNKFCGILLVVFLLGGLCNFGRVYLMNISVQRITKALREKVFNSILTQEVAYFDLKKTGELINRLSADTTLVSNSVTMNISDGLRSLIMVTTGVTMMFYMSIKLAMISLCIVPPVAAFAILYGRYIRKMATKVQDAHAEATQVAEERIANVRTVKAFSKEEKEMLTYRERMENILRLATQESLARGVFFGMSGLTGNGVALAVLYSGGMMVSDNNLSVGDLSAFLLYAAYIGISIGGLSSFYSELNRGLGASTRLWEIMDRVPQLNLAGKVSPTWEPAGEINFEKVEFAYPCRAEAKILQGLTLHVPKSSVTAVVGSSGSGKSTLASLLLRLYQPQSGQITLDNTPIEEFDIRWLRSHIGSVSQEPVLFSGTIKENILYGALDPTSVSDEKIISVLKEANAYQFVMKDLPFGVNTLVGERGIMLSGGQKQRIAIARALVKNPKILLLDEATSALDAESEHLVQEALERIMKGRTVLTIAHRLSTIKNADQIAVIDKGQIVELGSYSMLMDIPDGVFRKLVKHQTFQQD